MPVFTLRYDEQGERTFARDHLLSKYASAHKIERLILNLETEQSLRTNRNTGTFVEVTFDPVNPNCFLTVTSDDQAWVETIFTRLSAIIDKCRNHNGKVRNGVVHFLIQTVGVALCFFLSIAASRRLAPLILTENSQLLAFLFVFLVSANVWGYAQNLAFRMLSYVFPNIRFVRKGREHLHWLWQALVGAIVLAILQFVAENAWHLFTKLSAGVLAI